MVVALALSHDDARMMTVVIGEKRAPIVLIYLGLTSEVTANTACDVNIQKKGQIKTSFLFLIFGI